MNSSQTKKESNRQWYAIAFAAVLFATILLYLRFPFWLDLNDDVLMKDILSGAYTGTPSGHNIQMLYPLSAFLALLYRAAPSLPWYGLFLAGAQTVCLAMILGRALTLAGTRAKSAWTAVFFFALMGACFLPHAVFYQYTVTCALLAGTGAFLLYSGRGRVNDAISACLPVLAYLIRSEMLLLVLPLYGVALLFRVLRDKNAQEDTGDAGAAWLKTNVSIVIIIVLALGACSIVNGIAYGNDDWKTFVMLFNNRTELYDFHRIPSYEEHGEFYESVGLQQSEQVLLENYNYGLDESIDKTLLGDVAAYAAEIESQDQNGTEPVFFVTQYLYRLRSLSLPKGYAFPQSDMPWNLLTILSYIMWVSLLAHWKELWKPALLFMCRSSLWLYILMRGRDPIRITHGLYLVELLIITMIIITELATPRTKKNGLQNKITRGLAIIIPVAAMVLCFVSTITTVREEEAARSDTASTFRMLYAYMDDHPEQFYFMDVYTWVPYIEPLFEETGMRPANRDICGGWACKSPAYEEKLAAFGFSDMQSALLEENVFFVQKTEKDTEWLSAYYKDKGIGVRIEETERIADLFSVYQVSGNR